MKQAVNMATEEDKEFLLEQANELKEILDIMPGDVGTLNSLVFTYLELGEVDEAADYAMELRTVLTASGELEQLDSLAQAYLELAPDNLVFQELAHAEADAAKPVSHQPEPLPVPVAAVQEPLLTTEKEPASKPKIILSHSEPLAAQNMDAAIPAQETPSLPNQFGFALPEVSLDELSMQLNHELELGEFLKREQVITDEMCDTAVEKLIETSGDSSLSACLTLIAELNKVEHVNMQRVYGILSQKTNTPFIKVSQFKVSEELSDIIDHKTAKRLGIVLFSQMGREYMVATMNPIDETLQNTLQSYLKTKVHFYLTSADEVENYYTKLMI